MAIALLDADSAILERRRDEGRSPYLSVVSRVELIPGLYRKGQRDRINPQRLAAFLDGVEELPFTEREVVAYEQIIAARGFSRRLIVDRMIAATAISNGLALATLNPRDFRDIPGLVIEDWS